VKTGTTLGQSALVFDKTKDGSMGRLTLDLESCLGNRFLCLFGFSLDFGLKIETKGNHVDVFWNKNLRVYLSQNQLFFVLAYR
jgi:hypothetical protein